MLVAPSVLASDFSILAEEVKRVEEAGADWIHLDVMDGQFVPNLTFGIPVIASLRPRTQLPFDVHLMIKNPENLIQDFIDAGSDYITFHYEATTKPFELIQEIKQHGKKVGISLNPDTDIQVLDPFLPNLDLILLMSVNPGFGGQKFMPKVISKIKELHKKRQENPEFTYLLEVDGGINESTVKHVKNAGVDIVVAGSFIFKHNDYRGQIIKLKQE